MKKITLISLIASTLLLQSCTTPSPSSYLPDRGPTTKEAYSNHMSGEIGARGNNMPKPQQNNVEEIWNASTKINILPAFDASLSNSVNRELNSFKQDFSKVHNPEIVAYTYPHIDNNGNPVAGHFSAFHLYDKEHYALTRSEGVIYSERP